MKRVLMILALAIFLVSCGSSSSVPPGSTITINPSSTAITLDMGDLACTSGYISGSAMYENQFIVYVADPKGNPVPRANLNISYPFNYIAFYSDPSGANLINPSLPSYISVTTDDYGSYKFYVGYDYWASASKTGSNQLYTGSIQANSSDAGSAYGTSTLTVTVTSKLTPVAIFPTAVTVPTDPITKKTTADTVVSFNVYTGIPPYSVTSSPYSASTSSVSSCKGGFSVTIPAGTASGATDSVTVVDQTGTSATATITIS